jgi:putative ABC transport system permease protein
MGALWQDVRYGFRMFARTPGFTAVVVLTMALGIGGTTGIFSVVNAVLLRPMHFRDVNRLVMIWEQEKKTGKLWTVAPANYLDWRNQSTVFERLAIMHGWDYTLTGEEEAARLRGTKVSLEFFSTLGVGPALGRTFAPEETKEGGPPVVVLGHGVWQRLYGADPGLIGRAVALSVGFGGATECTVVGIMPAGFSFPDDSELWLPYAMDTKQTMERGGWCARVVARLKPGVTRTRAQAEMDVIAERLAQAYPASNRNFGVKVTSLHEHLVQNVRLLLYVFQGGVLLVLLVAVANVANLLLARSASRGREMTLRAALGAGRWRIMRQLLSESLLLGIAGGASGLLVAHWGVTGLERFAAGFVPRVGESNLDGRVLGFAFLVSLASGAIFGLAPAVRAAQMDLNACLKQGRTVHGFAVSRPSLAQHWLVIAEMALSLILLAGAGLLLKSFVLLGQVPLGFHPENLLTVELAEAGDPLSEELLTRLSSLPGVLAVGAVRDLPLSGPSYVDEASVEGELPKSAGEQRLLGYNSVTPDYFRAMGIPLLKGRGITEQDTKEAPPVAVVNETFVKQLLGGADPIGRRLLRGQRHTIVGVVGDVKYGGLAQEIQPHAYCSYQQERTLPVRNLVLRVKSDPMPWAASVREVVRSVEKDRPILSLQTMEERIDSSIRPQRLQVILASLFSAVSLALAAVGIYGLVSYSVAQRVSEFGIRAALGARRADILQLAVRQALWLVAAGLGMGLLGVFGFTRVLRSFLFHVQPLDPATLATASLFLACVALLASYVPARRAARIDPMVALRYE